MSDFGIGLLLGSLIGVAATLISVIIVDWCEQRTLLRGNNTVDK